MAKKLDQFVNNLKKDLSLFSGISIGVFLFILFFQPFWPERFSYNNKLIFVAGFGAIVFVVMSLIRNILPFFLYRKYPPENETGLLTIFENFLILALCSVAMAFYLRYVGWIAISFHIMLKVVVLCIIPPVILRISDKFTELENQRDNLQHESRILFKKLMKHKDGYLHKTIRFGSDNSAETVSLAITSVAFIRSADNYVEIVAMVEGSIKKMLIRNTLKNIERQLQPYSIFVRCHRTCIINSQYIEELKRRNSAYWLSLKGIDEDIPVSRQYLLRIKELT